MIQTIIIWYEVVITIAFTGLLIHHTFSNTKRKNAIQYIRDMVIYYKDKDITVTMVLEKLLDELTIIKK